MKLSDLLNFVRNNAEDVSDLTKVHSIETSESGDPYRNTQIKDLRERYEAKAEEADRDGFFSRLFGW